MKKIISLDIDGTITTSLQHIPQEVADFFAQLAQEGWTFFFNTGRNFHFGWKVLHRFSFPYYLAVQNGAIILKMPEQQVISKQYLLPSLLPALEQIAEGEETDVVIYTGFENQDICYYRPTHFAPELLDYLLKQRVQAMGELWHPVPSFRSQAMPSFSSAKYFGKKESLLRIAQKVQASLGLYIPLIRDPFHELYYVAQATPPGINKGFALREFKKRMGDNLVAIAAGDDYNDIEMLNEADITIVMQSAPSDMHDSAHIIAPPAIQMGIIQGLTQAVARFREKYGDL